MMEYYKHWNRYIDFINSRQSRQIPKAVLIERHHIIPRSLNGSDDSGNILDLTAREHFIAHMILWKCFSGKMAQAFWLISHLKYNKNKLTSRQYERLCADYSKVNSELHSGSKRSELTKKRIIDQTNIYLKEIDGF